MPTVVCYCEQHIPPGMGSAGERTCRRCLYSRCLEVEERGYWGGYDLIMITLDRHECFSVFHHLQKNKNANNATHYVKLGKKRREGSKPDYYIISPRVIIQAIIIQDLVNRLTKSGLRQFVSGALVRAWKSREAEARGRSDKGKYNFKSITADDTEFLFLLPQCCARALTGL